MSIHVERQGGPPDLPAAFKHFVVHGLGGRCLDDRQEEQARLGRFPDFACFRDLLLIEMKHLETDQNERVNTTFKSHANDEEMPFFYGQRRIDFDDFSNGEDIKAAVFTKLARTIESQLREANDQFEQYRRRNPRKNSLSLCLILNSRIEEFTPELVLHAVHRKMAPQPNGIRFPNIDAVVYISEKHVQRLDDGRLALAVVHFVGCAAEDARWKIEIVERVMRLWSVFRTGGAPVSGGLENSIAVEDIPPTMTQSEAWRLAYQRNPYLRAMPELEFKQYFHRCVALNAMSFLIGSWTKPSHEETMRNVRSFGDAIEEINHRGIDMRSFSPGLLSAEDRRRVYAGLPDELILKLSENQREQ